MNLIISNNSPTPIYEQIKNSLIDQIISGEIEENEPLPSIRILAKDIRVSVLTVKRAYDELEMEGYIRSIQGKGTFVAPKNDSLVQENVQKEIETYLEKAINLSKKHNIDKKMILELIELFYGE